MMNIREKMDRSSIGIGSSRPAWALGETSMLDVAELLIDGVSTALTSFRTSFAGALIQHEH